MSGSASAKGAKSLKKSLFCGLRLAMPTGTPLCQRRPPFLRARQSRIVAHHAVFDIDREEVVALGLVQEAHPPLLDLRGRQAPERLQISMYRCAISTCSLPPQFQRPTVVFCRQLYRMHQWRAAHHP